MPRCNQSPVSDEMFALAGRIHEAREHLEDVVDMLVPYNFVEKDEIEQLNAAVRLLSQLRDAATDWRRVR